MRKPPSEAAAPQSTSAARPLWTGLLRYCFASCVGRRCHLAAMSRSRAWVALWLLLASALCSHANKLRGPVFGCRVPRTYFVVKGALQGSLVLGRQRRRRRWRRRLAHTGGAPPNLTLMDTPAGFGQTDEGSGMDPFETGALRRHSASAAAPRAPLSCRRPKRASAPSTDTRLRCLCTLRPLQAPTTWRWRTPASTSST